MSGHPELVEGCVLCGKTFISSQALKPDTTYEGTQHPAPRTSHTRISRPAPRTPRRYNPNARLQMKRAMIAVLVGVAASPLLAGARGTVTGAYVEARTAEVFTGGCIMNSEAETVGKQEIGR